MTDVHLLLTIGSILVPAAATLTLPVQARSLRRVAAAACALATLLAAFAAAGSSIRPVDASTLGAWVLADRATTLGMSVYAAIACAAFALVPSGDLTRARTAGLLTTISGTLLAGASANPLLLVVGWTLSAAPFIVGPLVVGGVWRPRVALALSCVAIAVGAVLMLTAQVPSGLPTFTALAGSGAGGRLAFTALMMAIVLRKGIFPAHAWVADVTETGALSTALLVNGHLGAVLLVRAIIPVFPSLVDGSFVLLSDLALFTALYAAVRAVAEPHPRRVLALVVLSQSACILAGLESGTPEGTAGAFIHLGVVALSTTALFGVLRAVEARTGAVGLGRHHGLAQATPRLAVAFAVSALALVGLPGTLGFAAEDLLVHGSLASHPQVGLLLPLATALNAVCLFRLFGRVFLGASRPPARGIDDALPRERWALTAIVLVLVAGGILPQVVFGWTGLAAADAPAAQAISAGPGPGYLPPAVHRRCASVG